MMACNELAAAGLVKSDVKVFQCAVSHKSEVSFEEAIQAGSTPYRSRDNTPGPQVTWSKPLSLQDEV